MGNSLIPAPTAPVVEGELVIRNRSTVESAFVKRAVYIVSLLIGAFLYGECRKLIGLSRITTPATERAGLFLALIAAFLVVSLVYLLFALVLFPS
jgi:hypothetical protein